ncbi:hypothetical protein ACFO5X_22055 [Seohaeicola nanhaiensis]|uniref:SnoaL-like domain-containing protein n=1 Tax=Seohaeicola nanhaiensis TaxID=1387282 RepID=A0ABV9KNQ7_9RHOB
MANFQSFIDKIIDAIRRDDLESYLPLIDLPYLINTAAGSHFFVRQSELVDNFHLFRMGFFKMGFVDASAKVVSSTMLGESLASFIFETQPVREDGQPVDPYLTCMTVRKVRGRWCAISATASVGMYDWHERMKLTEKGVYTVAPPVHPDFAPH